MNAALSGASLLAWEPRRDNADTGKPTTAVRATRGETTGGIPRGEENDA